MRRFIKTKDISLSKCLLDTLPHSPYAWVYMTCKTIDELEPWYPRTEEEWRAYMTPTIILDGVETRVANAGFEVKSNRPYYVPFGKPPFDLAARIYRDWQMGDIRIDPRYSHDQNRHASYYLEAYRGTPEQWAYEGDTPHVIRAPYESAYRARLADERARGVVYDYKYQWLTDPK